MVDVNIRIGCRRLRLVQRLSIGLAVVWIGLLLRTMPKPAAPPPPSPPVPIPVASDDELTHVPLAKPDEPTPMDFGWAGPAAVADLADWANAQPRFELVDEQGRPVWQDNESANVRLWQMIAHSGGEYPDPGYQQTGDCTSWGQCHSIIVTQGGQAARGDAIEVKALFQPFSYGAGRVWIWAPQIGGVRKLPSAGCSGAALAKAAQVYGVVPKDTPGLPEYSGALADKWGREGPPEWLKEIAARHKVKTVARIDTVEECRSAIANYFGVSCASPWGNPAGKYVRQDGRWVARHTGVWHHQMCVDGYDGSAPSGKRYFHITNSWPKSQHPAPIDDSPPGGFWIEETDMALILSAGDSWAFSDFEGFPARNKDLDFSPLRRKPAPPAEPLPRGASAALTKGSVF